jgi:recombination protein RecR
MARRPPITSPKRWRASASVTSLAQGVPIGGELDYLDDGTISAALKARKAL